jgi:catechol 2,3-dioxygenase-like lactoylglutathione lyase family enzyme
LAPFLHECPNEVLGIRLEHIVDLVQDRVDVFGELLVPLAHIGRRIDGLVDLVLVRALRPALAAVVGRHRGPLSRFDLTLARTSVDISRDAVSDTAPILAGMTVPGVVSLITLGVSDVAASTRFYSALGFELSSGSVEGEVSFFRTAGARLGLYGADDLRRDAQAGPPGEPGAFRGVTLAINVASPEIVDTALEVARTAGARIAKPAQATDWGGYHAYFADPDAHLWEIAHNPYWPIGPDGVPQLP